jgi:multiple sugar transport system substrate-binding protein
MIDQRVKTILPGRTIHRTRRQILRDSGLAGGALATGFATSSGPWFVRGASAQDKTKIKVWFPYPLIPEQGEEVQTYAQLINDFNAQSTTTEAEVFTTNWSPEKLVTAVAGGDPPDIFYMDRYLAAEWAARQLLEPLSDRLTSSSVVHAADIWEKLINDVTYKDTIYAVPHYTDVRAFYWNKSLYTTAGLDPEVVVPTWTVLKEYIPQLLIKNDKGQIDQLGYAPSIGNPPGFLMWYIHLWQLGGEFMNPEKTQVTFNNDAGVGSFQFMLDTYELQGGVDPVDEFSKALVPGPGQDIFMLGKLGMEVNGDWMPPNFARYAPDLQWGIGAIPIPEGGQASNYNGGHAWVIPRGAKNPDQAWELIEWMLKPESQLKAGLGENTIPARQAVAESTDYLEGEPKANSELRKLFVEQFKVSKWVPVIPGVGEIFASNQRAFDAVMHKVSTPEEATKTMADECQGILDNWQSQIQQ